ncbi:MAG TPA: hypothetical protein VGE74_24395 [Gemmata sp.]
MCDRVRLWGAAVGVALGAVLAGCSGKGELIPPLHPLSGTVVRGDTLVTGGGLYFAPDPPTNSSLTVNAAVKSDGTFTAETLWTTSDGKTQTRPGAPAGKYRVIYHPPSDGSKSGLEVTLVDPVIVAPDAPPVKLVLPVEQPKGAGMERDDVPPKP